MEKVGFLGSSNRVSWGSIIAGAVTVLSVSVLLSILGSSIGLYMFNPMDSNPASGIGTTMGIWTAIALLISLAAGSFVAGKLAGRDGFIHGFLVWALTLIISVILGLLLAVGTVRLTANILGSVSSAVGSVASAGGSALESSMSGLSDQASKAFGDLNVESSGDNSNVSDNVRQALKKSGVKEFQPEYINNQLNDVKADLSKTIQKIVTNPQNADNIINGFTDRLQKRMDTYSSKIDRNDLTKAIANNSNMSQAEVDQTVDQYLEIRDNAIKTSKETIANLQQSLNQAQQEWNEMKQEALKQVDEASNVAATSALISFFALLIGAVLSAFVGRYGANKTQVGYDA